MDLAALHLLAGVVTHRVVFGAAFFADLTDWLSRTAAEGLASRPIRLRYTMRNSAAQIASHTPSRWNKYLFPSSFRSHPHLSTRQYARIVHAWVESAGLDGSAYGTHSMRRTKAAQI